jgi:hypothetical protein
MSPKRQKSVLESIFEENISQAPMEPKSAAYQAKDEATEHISSDLKAQAEREDIPGGLTSTEISISAVKAKSSKKRTNKSRIEEIHKKISTVSEELTYVNKNYFTGVPEFNITPLPIINLDYANNPDLNDINLSCYPFVKV